MSDKDQNRIEGERGETAKTPRRGINVSRQKMFAGVSMVAIGVVAIGYFLLTGNGDAQVSTTQQRVQQIATFEAASPPPAQTSTQLASTPLPAAAVPVEEEPVDPLLEAATRAPVMAFDATGFGAGNGADGGAREESGFVPFPQQGGENEDGRFQRMMKPTLLEGSKAGLLGNRNFIVAMGASIPCVLETALSSDQPGFASCVITRDVLSDNGRVVLMEKGTQVVGEYRGSLARGKKRLFVLWNRAKTPSGVIVTLASPASDALGRAGLDGYVDTHWWERFGSAMLLSVVGDVGSYVSDRLSDSDVSADETTSAGQDAAAIAVEQSINIPPTLIKHQGELVSIFVARDLDFSDVYDLKVTEPRTQIYDRAAFGTFARTEPPMPYKP